ncbi:hypothetical protein ACFSQP_00705 [Bizionia sediminis]|uniref:Uncharacterized protein n=1 Tax=Bizionia sediminis TaxID=1737064 RepID=A0ABW5KNX2_9FLAO
MKHFFLIGMFMFGSFFSVQAQNSLEPVTTIKSMPIAINQASSCSVLPQDIAARKKDILTKKIESKINGKINLFTLKETRVIC